MRIAREPSVALESIDLKIHPGEQVAQDPEAHREGEGRLCEAAWGHRIFLQLEYVTSPGALATARRIATGFGV